MTYNPAPKAPRIPPAMTAEQDAVLVHMRTSGQSLCLIACAGAGKSTMIVEVMAQSTPGTMPKVRWTCATPCTQELWCGGHGLRPRPHRSAIAVRVHLHSSLNTPLFSPPPPPLSPIADPTTPTTVPSTSDKDGTPSSKSPPVLRNLPSLDEWVHGGGSHSAKAEPTDGSMESRVARFDGACVCGKPILVGQLIISSPITLKWYVRAWRASVVYWMKRQPARFGGVRRVLVRFMSARPDLVARLTHTPPRPYTGPAGVHEECATYNPAPTAPRTPPDMTA